jgi:hypothetical protein
MTATRATPQVGWLGLPHCPAQAVKGFTSAAVLVPTAQSKPNILRNFMCVRSYLSLYTLAWVGLFYLFGIQHTLRRSSFATQHSPVNSYLVLVVCVQWIWCQIVTNCGEVVLELQYYLTKTDCACPGPPLPCGRLFWRSCLLL